MALVLRNALRGGHRGARFTALGVAAGVVVWGVATGLGLALVLARSAELFTLIKLAGAAYLVYLGVRALLRPVRRTSVAEAPPAPPVSARACFVQGLGGNLLNPKAGVIFVTILPQFIHAGDGVLRLAAMLAVFESRLLLWLWGYGYAVARAGNSHAGRRLRIALQRLTGLVLIGLGARLALER